MDPIHDFTAKLRQPSLAASVERYVGWRREVLRALGYVGNDTKKDDGR